MKSVSTRRRKPFLALVDRLQVIVHESSGISLLAKLQAALLAGPAVTHVEVAVIRGLVARLAARAIHDASLDGRGLRAILDAESIADVCHGLGLLLEANPVPAADERIERVLEHLRLHYPDREVTRLSVLASIAQVTPTHLSRLMRKRTGEGVVAHARKLRITRAVELLNRGDTIAGAAHSVGYRHQADFSRDFQRVMGITPGRFLRHGRPN
jgi:AraC-like DNA-binding protein